MTLVARAADQPSKGLRQFCADHAIVIIGAAIGQASRAVENIWAWPRHLLHDDEPQRISGYIDAVAQRISAEQARVRVVAEDIDQCAGVNGIDMLRVER